MAVGREQRELCPGAVLKIVWLAAGSLLGDGVTRFGQVTAGFILHQTVFRDHQGQPAVDDGLCRDQLLDVPHLWEPQLEGQAGGGELLAPEIVQRAAVEHVEAEVTADSQPRVPQKRQMADVPRQSGGDAQLFGVSQPRPELGFISVPPDTGKNGTPLPGKVRQRVPLRQQLQGEVDVGGGQGQQRFRLRPGCDGNGQGRGIGGAVQIRQGGEVLFPADRNGTTGVLQGGQSIPAKSVYRPGGEKQAVCYIGGAVRTAEGGAACLLQTGFQIGSRQCLVLSRLRDGAFGGGHMAVIVPNCQGNRLSGLTGAGEMDGNGAGVVLFVFGPGGGKQFLRLRGVFRAGAKHGGTVTALPVVRCKAGAGEGQLQILFFGGGGLAALPDQTGVNVRDDRHIFRALHAAFQFQAADIHSLHVGNAVSKAAVLQTEGVGVFGGAVEAVGQAAGLGAGAPVAAASANEGAHFALAGVAHAESTMAEDLDLGGTGLADGGGVLPGTFPGEDHPLAAIPIDLVGTAGGKDAHLSAGVKGEVRQGLPQQGKQAPVLHQHGVHPETAGRPGGI